MKNGIIAQGKTDLEIVEIFREIPLVKVTSTWLVFSSLDIFSDARNEGIDREVLVKTIEIGNEPLGMH